jgi:hypothetical protein
MRSTLGFRSRYRLPSGAANPGCSRLSGGLFTFMNCNRYLLQRLHIYAYFEFVIAPAQNHAAHGTDVAVIPAPR